MQQSTRYGDDGITGNFGRRLAVKSYRTARRPNRAGVRQNS
ncbi:hypothetical protein S1OALGB6SA_632 [Olavius algarvensis spirochete endosymbiont]|nr:hypothetical protein [Olavius algarvensis spirochete endosymbiont]VDA99562.1 hypothetical protein S1OALGB6SA_632 [Olavius algarvensis spirochete endosymbiont]